MKELKLCPFCGSPGRISKMWFAASWRYFPECSGCGVRPQSQKDARLGYGEWQPHFVTVTEAENLWNNRHLTSRSSRAAEICPCCGEPLVMGVCETGCGYILPPA